MDVRFFSMTKKITAKEILTKLISLFKKTVVFLKGDKARDFFLGYYYPVVVIALTFISHVTSLEWLFCALILIPTFFAVLFYDSIVPLITPACCLAMHVARDNINGAVNPASPDFYLGDGGVVFLVLMIILIVGSIGTFFFLRWRRGFFKGLKLRDIPLLLPSALLSLALLLNGVFAEGYTAKNLFVGFFEVLTLFFFFYVFYLGLRGEKYEALLDKFCYISALVALLLTLEVGWLYLTDPNILASGSIDKQFIVFGWGCSNNAGSMLGVAIPACFLGLMRKPKHAWFYLTIATLAGIASIATLSRNALLIVTAIYIISFAITMFFGGAKKFSRIAFPIVMAVIVIILVAQSESIRLVFADYFNKGMNDNGRYVLWDLAIPAFLSAPIFGRGFFGLEYSSAMTAFIPGMLHCTPFQLIAATGIFGFGSYLYYRVMTVIRLFRRPTVAKFMLALCVSVIIVGSLLDNFIFYMQQMIHPSIALAFMYLADENKENA